jgi:hypothetical protein
MKTFVVDRSKWLRGEGGLSSFLCREYDEKMCILGFFGESLGIPRSVLKGKKSPTSVKSLLWPSWLTGADMVSSTPDCNSLISDNDEAGPHAEAERQRRIQKTFAKYGIDVLFADPG